MNILHTQFTVASLLVALTLSLVAAQSPDEMKAALAAHDHAVHINDIWVRDPYITLGPDGYYYYTGTTQRPDMVAAPETQLNTGLGSTSLVGWQIRVWRSKDLVHWESLGCPCSLKDSIWYQTARETFDKVPQKQWRVWAPELHFVNGHWAVIFTTPAPLAPKVGASLMLSAGEGLHSP